MYNTQTESRSNVVFLEVNICLDNYKIYVHTNTRGILMMLYISKLKQI
jgi:hypothetical protein